MTETGLSLGLGGDDNLPYCFMVAFWKWGHGTN